MGYVDFLSSPDGGPRIDLSFVETISSNSHDPFFSTLFAFQQQCLFVDNALRFITRGGGGLNHGQR